MKTRMGSRIAAAWGGGMAKAIGTGMPKLRIEESAARRQARIDQGKDVIVGVNKYQIEEDVDLEILEVPASVRDDQIARLKKLKTTRDPVTVQQALEALTRAATVENMWSFAERFPGATRITLEQNYRSTTPILEVANAVIECNVDRKPKRLRTDREHGDAIRVVRCGDCHAAEPLMAGSEPQCRT